MTSFSYSESIPDWDEIELELPASAGHLEAWQWTDINADGFDDYIAISSNQGRYASAGVYRNNSDGTFTFDFDIITELDQAINPNTIAFPGAKIRYFYNFDGNEPVSPGRLISLDQNSDGYLDFINFETNDAKVFLGNKGIWNENDTILSRLSNSILGNYYIHDLGVSRSIE